MSSQPFQDQPTPTAMNTRQTIAQLWTLAYPIIGLNVLNVLALAVDTAMCGRLPNAEAALTALGFATQVVFLFIVGMMGLTIGTVAIVARAYGAGDHDRVNHVLHQSTWLTVILSLIVAILGNVAAPLLVSVLGASGDALELAVTYLRPMLSGTVFAYLTLLYGGALRGVGNTRIPFLIALLYNGLNVLFNYGLILGNFGLPALGVQGAALGTVMANAVGAAAMVMLLRRGAVPGLHLPLKPTAIDTALARDLIRVGAPAALDMVILNVAFMVIVGMLGRIDEVAVAAHGMGLRVQALAFVPGLSVSQATGALVGQALGAGDAQQARRVVRVSVVMTTAIMSLLAIVIVGAVEPIVAIFDVAPNTPLGQFTTTWIKVLGYGMPAVGIYIAFIGMLQGAGETRVSLRINFFVTLLCQLPLAGLLGFTLGLGATGIWASLPLSFIVKSIAGAIVYQRGRWANTGAEVKT
ncbi:MAG: MATE family efflux transporter [Myxococcota bacterium]